MNKTSLATIFLFFFSLSVVFSQYTTNKVTLLWDRNSETNVIGYRIYSGPTSRAYDRTVDVGNDITGRVTVLQGMTYFAVTAYDRDGLESKYSLEVTFFSTNDTPPIETFPVSKPDFYTTTQNVRLIIPAPGVISNDSNVVSVAINSTPLHGTVTLFPNGSFDYMPNFDFVGDDNFSYRGIKSTNHSVTNVFVTVLPTPTTNVLTVVDDFYSMVKNTTIEVPANAILSNDFIATLTPTVAQYGFPTNGDVILYADGRFVYTPTTDWVGIDMFRYRVFDGNAWSTPAKITISVTNTVSGTNTLLTKPIGLEIIKIEKIN